jgi:hypothetical protein
MFLQEIINKKINDTDDLDIDDQYSQTMGYENTANKRTMKKTNLIGSIGNGCINYPKDQKFFHSNDIPEKAREANKQMKALTDKDVFKIKRPEWNPSISKAGLPADDNDENNLFSIRKGFSDFMPLSTKEPKIYEGADSREKHYTGWNVSNQVPIALHNEKTIAEETIMRMTKTKEMNERILSNYQSPFEQAKQHSKMLSTQREQLKDMKETLRDHPDAEQIIKNTFYNKPKNDEYEDKANLTFKPDLTKTLASRRRRVYHHTGLWEKSKFEDEEAWSCCMNYDKDSEGCNVKIVDMDRYNVVSF